MKTALLYAMLVGLPVFGLFAVLRAGVLIVPPPSVGGAWRVTEGAQCSVPGQRFAIEQSGVFVRLRLPGRSDLPARLENGRLVAVGGERANVSPGCRSEAVRIDVRVGENIPERITGLAGIPGCGGCPVRPFVAVRDTLAARAAQPTH